MQRHPHNSNDNGGSSTYYVSCWKIDMMALNVYFILEVFLNSSSHKMNDCQV